MKPGAFWPYRGVGTYAFWMEVYTAFSIGVQQMVPVIRHDLQQAEWQAMARLLIYGLSFRGGSRHSQHPHWRRSDFLIAH